MPAEPSRARASRGESRPAPPRPARSGLAKSSHASRAWPSPRQSCRTEVCQALSSPVVSGPDMPAEACHALSSQVVMRHGVSSQVSPRRAMSGQVVSSQPCRVASRYSALGRVGSRPAPTWEAASSRVHASRAELGHAPPCQVRPSPVGSRNASQVMPCRVKSRHVQPSSCRVTSRQPCRVLHSRALSGPAGTSRAMSCQPSLGSIEGNQHEQHC